MSESARPDPAVVELAHRMFDLARDGDADTLLAYVDAGVPVELTDSSGNTLLMLAAYHGHADIVQRLLDAGADVNRLNDRGQSPLAGAIFKGEDLVVSVLIGAGADPDLGTPSARATAAMFGRDSLLT
ncbi:MULTISPECIES: ankyrin repeat domain-containing protein [Mumia]|uniref:ankyrin repeat domain-containing protein n=1 Tax=Mumia TaxID=1546255 RepID=UPI00141D96F1|nr:MULTISPECIES: ankyrin repeat domain-containing protein [unclassified Mumia]QMW66093.1 ankyrin repeat domain-containing protein [Mumia sp. ZJ1417]